MKELKIGETFTYKEKSYIVAEPQCFTNTCAGCAFSKLHDCYMDFECGRFTRSDAKDVIAKLIEP